ncbi:MAG: alpha/beta fold hydrolase [Christensenellales bacterium]
MGHGSKDIVFLHGWGGSIDSFWGVAQFFCKKYRCILVDFYGFGGSKIDRVLTLQDYCDGVEEVMECLGIEKATLVGHSFGGRVAIQLAATTDRAKAVILVDSAGLKPRMTLKKALRTLRFKILKALGKSTERCGSKDYRELDPVMKRTFVNIVNYHQDDILHTIDCPTLIVWGKHDKDTPRYMAKRLNKNIHNSQLVYLKGGHWCYIERLGDFVNTVWEWLKLND